jgi:hypothetical protein
VVKVSDGTSPASPGRGQNLGFDREFSYEEGALLAFIDVLLGLRSGAPPLPSVMARGVFNAVLPTGAERAKGAALRFLAESGLEQRTVLREGRIASGRLWDRRLNEGLVLRFGPGFFEFAWMLARRIASLRERKTPKSLAVAPSSRTGDMILYTLAWRALPGLGLLPDNMAIASRALARSNTFTGLHALDVEEALDLSSLLDDAPRLVELAEASLEEAWTSHIQTHFPPTAGAAERFQHMRLALGAYVSALEAAHRLDLAGPVLGALRRTIEPLAGVDVRALAMRSGKFSSIAARDQHFRTIAALFDIGRGLARRSRQLAGARYGDDHYDEARAFVTVFERSFAGVASENDRIHAELVPVVGG